MQQEIYNSHCDFKTFQQMLVREIIWDQIRWFSDDVDLHIEISHLQGIMKYSLNSAHSTTHFNLKCWLFQI